MKNAQLQRRTCDSENPGMASGSPILRRQPRGQARSAECARSSGTDSSSQYLSPNDLAARWRISRRSLDRLVQEEGFTKLFLGDARNSSVRFRLDEVLRYEQEHEVRLSARP